MKMPIEDLMTFLEQYDAVDDASAIPEEKLSKLWIDRVRLLKTMPKSEKYWQLKSEIDLLKDRIITRRSLKRDELDRELITALKDHVAIMREISKSNILIHNDLIMNTLILDRMRIINRFRKWWRKVFCRPKN